MAIAIGRGIRYFGLYGWERGRRSPLPASALIALRRVCTELSIHLSAFRGVWVEDKHFSLSVHFLGVPPRVEHRARRKLRSVLRPFHKSLRVIENLRDAEIVPRIFSWLSSLPVSGTRTICKAAASVGSTFRDAPLSQAPIAAAAATAAKSTRTIAMR